jgi:hypothetical protein
MVDLFDFDYSQPSPTPVPAKKQPAGFRIPKIGDPIYIPSLHITGTVEYIDHPFLYHNHYYPIQILLDNPYEEQLIFRTNLKDLELKV